MTTLESLDVAQARQYFDETRGRIAEVTDGLSEGQWRFKPAPDRWSIAENVEHMVIVHDRILGRVRQELAQAPAPPSGHDCREVDAIVLKKIPDRSIKAKAPEFIEPTGTLVWSDALNRLSRNYELLMEFIESTPDLREHVLDSPPLRVVTNGAYGTMDGYQWAITAAAHDRRHIEQILEIKTDPNYPRN